MRLDQALARSFGDYSRTSIKNWIEEGMVTLNLDCARRPSLKVRLGDTIKLLATLNASESIKPQKVKFGVIHRDESFIVIDKPPGLVVHPGAGNPDGTLVNGLLEVFPELEALPRAGLVHRIDKLTSGLLLVARTPSSYQQLVRAMARRDIARTYDGIVNGVLVGGGTIDAAVARDPTQRTRMCIAKSGRKAVTHYRVKKRFRAHTLVEFKLETGRTHQIRVHMSSLRYPIVGDIRYGGRRLLPSTPSDKLVTALDSFARHALHARRLIFIHPSRNEQVSFESPVPRDVAELIRALETDMKAIG